MRSRCAFPPPVRSPPRNCARTPSPSACWRSSWLPTWWSSARRYNFSIPTQLKAWIDRLAQPGRTFRYTASGPEGLAAGKTVIVALSRGGVYSTSEGGQAMEHQESYLQTVFGFFGITDVRFVRAEGVALGADGRNEALANAARDIRRHTQGAANEAQVARVA